MKPEFLYLEPDGEITELINRIRSFESELVVVVIPRGSSLGQSIVNLKLLTRKAEDFDKKIALVSSDQTCQSLASQLGIIFFERLSDAKKADFEKAFKEISKTRKEDNDDQDEIQPILQPNEEPQVVAEKNVKADTGGLVVKTYSKYQSSPEATAKEAKSETKPEEDVDEEMPETAEEEQQEMTQDFEEEEEEQVKAEPKEKVKEIQSIKSSDNEPRERTFVYTPQKHKSPRNSSKVGLILGALVLLVGIISYLFLPYAKASVILSTNDLKNTKEIIVDTNQTSADEVKLILPGKMLTLEKETQRTFDSTGEKNIGEKAKGIITAYNAWSEEAENLPIGSTFAAGSKIFTSTKAVSIPGATTSFQEGELKVVPGSVDVTVEAKESGETYNLAPSDFSITSLPAKKQSKIYGKSKSAMTGGSNRILKIVTKEDQEKAVKTLEESLQPDAVKGLQDLANQDKLVFFDKEVSNENITQEFSKEVGAESDTFDLKIKKKFFSIGFSESQLKDLVILSTKNDLSDDEMLVNPDKSEISYEFVSGDIDAGTSKIKVNFTGKSGAKIEKSEIMKEIKNKNTSVAVASVKAITGVKDIKLDSWPNFLNRTPLFDFRISVDFDFTN